MDSMVKSHCRLCAELRPSDKLLNLQLDEKKRKELVEKLDRVNATTDFSEEYLPKTVCFVCVNTLDRAFEFVQGIAIAQSTLNNIFLIQQIKKEDTTPSDDDYFLYDEAEELLKSENVAIKQESDDSAEPRAKSADKKIKKRGKKKKLRKVKSEVFNIDAVPLSQLKLSWKDYSWVCGFCETQFPTVDELKNHSIQYHDCCNAFRCSDCSIRKLRLDSFLIHVKRHRKYLKLSCYKCHKRFTSSRQLTVHVLEHKDKDFICHGCNSTFLTSEELNNHVNLYCQSRKTRPIPEVPQSSDDLTCVLCKKTFKHRGSLTTHLLIHTERKRDHTCDKCGKCFLNKQNLAGHMVLHDNLRPYQCEICKAAFKTHGQLRNHVGVHDNRKPYACDQCGRCFRLQKQLTSHSIIHTDALPYTCSFCNKAFRFKTILNQHIRQHTGVKPYSCEVCQRDFTNWPNYNKHMKRRHGMDMAKKKHTPDGVYPINPATGEIIIHTETTKLLEWKKQMMSQRKPGRPKSGIKLEDEGSTIDPNVSEVGHPAAV